MVKKNAAEYYIAIKDVLKEKGKNNYKILSEKKDAKRKYSRNRWKNMKEKISLTNDLFVQYENE